MVSLAAAVPAAGVTWGSASNPVFGYENGVKFGKMFGNFYNDNSVSAMSTTYQYDLQPGGNNVRVETDFAFFRVCETHHTAASWCFDISKQTVETNSASWVKDSRARNLRRDSNSARGAINICEIRSFANDPCSAHAIPKFDY